MTSLIGVPVGVYNKMVTSKHDVSAVDAEVTVLADELIVVVLPSLCQDFTSNVLY